MYTVHGTEGPGTGGRSTEDVRERSRSSLSGMKLGWFCWLLSLVCIHCMVSLTLLASRHRHM